MGRRPDILQITVRTTHRQQGRNDGTQQNDPLAPGARRGHRGRARRLRRRRVGGRHHAGRPAAERGRGHGHPHDRRQLRAGRQERPRRRLDRQLRDPDVHRADGRRRRAGHGDVRAVGRRRRAVQDAPVARHALRRRRRHRGPGRHLGGRVRAGRLHPPARGGRRPRGRGVGRLGPDPGRGRAAGLVRRGATGSRTAPTGA